MRKAIRKITALASALGSYTNSRVSLYGEEPHTKRPRKVWDDKAKCYRIKGQRVDKNGKPIEGGER